MTSLPQLKLQSNNSPKERLTALKDYLKEGNEILRKKHEDGQSGVANCEARRDFIDHLLVSLYQAASRGKTTPRIALVANGGYGRGYLNPGSDLDILFLTDKPGHRLNQDERDFIDRILYPLWDLNFTVGHACRNSAECLEEGKRDPITRTTLFDSRFLIGEEKLFTDFQTRFRKELIEKPLTRFLEERKTDIATRAEKYGNTVFLQEPNLKESPGGLRDYHNLIWIADAIHGTRDPEALRDLEVFSENGRREISEAFEFLLRLRNDLHYREGKEADILTLRRQGPVSEFFDYPHEDLLKKI